MKSSQKQSDGFEFDSLSSWKEAGRVLLEEASEKVREKTKAIRGKSLDEISDDVTSYVQQNPFKSLLMALGLGLIFGMLFKRNK